MLKTLSAAKHRQPTGLLSPHPPHHPHTHTPSLHRVRKYRGIGHGLVQKLLERSNKVIATARVPQEAQQLQKLAAENSNLTVAALDVSKPESIAAFAAEVKKHTPHVDVSVSLAMGGLHSCAEAACSLNRHLEAAVRSHDPAAVHTSATVMAQQPVYVTSCSRFLQHKQDCYASPRYTFRLSLWFTCTLRTPNLHSQSQPASLAACLWCRLRLRPGLIMFDMGMLFAGGTLLTGAD